MSIFAELSPMLLLLGLAAGILSAMLGVGSGILLVPALAIVFGLTQKSAQGTALAVMVPMALVGVMRYGSNPDIEINVMRVGLLSLGAIVGALVGSAIAAHLSNAVLRRIFAMFLLVVAVRMLLPKRAAARSTAPQAADLSEQGGPND
ncbi:MAG: sulfite exporter TauE/SafE family protein [Kiritimatiellae bacterium]|nr:sulfite exporter TauE/SafE family protein [Kiritimatiellia bacterium]